MLILLSKRRRRFGDLVAWTAVVHADYAPLPPEPAEDDTEADDDNPDQDPDGDEPMQ